MTHEELITLLQEVRKFELQARNRSFDEESYSVDEIGWFANLAATLSRVFPIVDEAQRKAGRREKGNQNVT
jgi:hypothetical protein